MRNRARKSGNDRNHARSLTAAGFFVSAGPCTLHAGGVSPGNGSRSIPGPHMLLQGIAGLRNNHTEDEMPLTPEIMDAALEALEQGIPVIQSSKKMGFAQGTFYLWAGKPEYSERYARAREIMAHVHASEIVDIADSEPDPAKARNRMDARKWFAAKCAPKSYGDKLDVEHKGGVTINLPKAAADI